MSGRKDCYAGLSRERMNELMSQMRQNYNVAMEAQRLGIMHDEAEQIARDSMGNLLELLQRQINLSGEEVRQLANNQNRRLREQATRFTHDINTLREQHEKDRAELAAAIRSVQDGLEAKERNHRRIAEFWIAQTQGYLDDIAAYRHELFTPGQLAVLRSQLAQVTSDLENEAFQAVIAASRSIFHQAVDLKERVVNAEIEWAHYHAAFRNLFADVQSNLFHYQSLQYEMPSEEGTVTIDANLDYWANGALSQFAEEMAAIQERTSHVEELSTAELVELIGQLRSINTHMEQAATFAREEMVSSQVRAELADNIATTLQLSGWEFVGYTYEGSEMNAALHVKLRDNLGNEIVTIISPQRDKENNPGNNMEFNFFSDFNNDENTRNIWVAAILEQLRRAGLDVGKPKTRPGYENRSSDNQAIRDLEATARRKV